MIGKGMKKIYTKLSLIALFIMFAAIATAQTLFYHDSFIPGQSKWQNFDSGNISALLDGGKYILTQKYGGVVFEAASIPLDNKRNYSIETEVVHLSGTDQFPMGLVFASKDRNDNYYFAISANGNFIFVQRQQGIYSQAIINWTFSDAIVPGANRPNKLRIEKRNDTLTFKINGQQVGQIFMVPPMGNQIGFYMENAQSVAFDYLTINYLDAPVKDTVKKTTDIPVNAIVNKPVEAPAKDTVKKATDIPVNAIVNKPVDIPAKDTVKKTTDIPVNAIVNKPVDVPAKDTVKKTVDVQVNTIVNKPNDERDTVNRPLSTLIAETPFHFDFNDYTQEQWELNSRDFNSTRLREGILKMVHAHAFQPRDVCRYPPQLFYRDRGCAKKRRPIQRLWLGFWRRQFAPMAFLDGGGGLLLYTLYRKR
jgi:hypothetical protein